MLPSFLYCAILSQLSKQFLHSWKVACDLIVDRVHASANFTICTNSSLNTVTQYYTSNLRLNSGRKPRTSREERLALPDFVSGDFEHHFHDRRAYARDLSRHSCGDEAGIVVDEGDV
ncbi:hypothetical protein G7Y89_g5368 [Cudoniella acicularis]|uniref:Uncharacterized protein n=1 Tax=Cudoniella acicularis TaxID=354080 RepID=A0A8H4RMM1_9HELO|nr:hypothetical protein G7Y89_g5368 [Cudoniella acicularis]